MDNDSGDDETDELRVVGVMATQDGGRFLGTDVELTREKLFHTYYFIFNIRYTYYIL